MPVIGMPVMQKLFLAISLVVTCDHDLSCVCVEMLLKFDLTFLQGMVKVIRVFIK